MTKILGSIIIIASWLLLFYRPLYSKNQRIHFLFDLITLLRAAEQELSSNLYSIPELINTLIDRTSKSLSKSLNNISEMINQNGVASFSKYWHKEIDSYSQHLRWNELEKLICLGDILGQYILPEQIKSINDAIIVLEEGYQITKNELVTSSKTNLGVGLSLGMIFVIALL